MKVLMINGSSRNNGCTRAALDIMAETFKEEGIETEIIFIGNQPIADCMNCKKCVTEHQCIFDDVVNEITTKAKDCDGFIFASPVYYAHPSARLLAVLDRAFYSNKSVFVYKPGACIFSARRAEIQNVRYVRQLLNFFSGDVALVSEIGSRDYFPCRQWQFIKSYCRIFFLVPADDIVTFVPYGLEKICRNLVRTDFNPLVEKCAKDIVKNVFGVVQGIALSPASG